MKSIGLYMMLGGVISIVLNFLGRELVILSWIDNWGETVGWIIKGGLIVVGGLLYFLMPAAAEEEQQVAEETN